MSKKIIGVTVGSPLPKPNLKQTDPSKGDYVKGKDIIPTKLSQLENDSGFVTADEAPKAFYVNITTDDGENWVADKTYPEVYDAYMDGGIVYMKIFGGAFVLPLIMATEDEIGFSGIAGNTGILITLDSSSAVSFADVDYPDTDAINALIDEKLAAITNAEEVAF